MQDTSNSEALKKVFEQVPTAVSEPVSPAVSEPVPPAVSQQVFSEISEQGPPTKEGLVIDTELVRKLTSENEKLKVTF